MLCDYYSKYKKLHTHRASIGLHILGNLITLLFLGWCVYNQLWIALLFAPFIVYPFAWSGHFFFERNIPAAWTNPIKAKMCDWIMMKDVLLRKYND